MGTEEETRWERMVEARVVKEWRAEEEGELREAARVESRRRPMEVVVRRSTSTMMIVECDSGLLTGWFVTDCVSGFALALEAERKRNKGYGWCVKWEGEENLYVVEEERRKHVGLSEGSWPLGWGRSTRCIFL
jgi:hypothetical protein